jgi:hypothetical protein
MVVWFLFVAVAWTGVRLLFSPVYFLVSVAEFTPGFVLVPLAGLYAGPAGVAGIVAGTLLGDLLLGQWGGMTMFRVLAYGLGALYMMVLSDPALLAAGWRGRWAIGLRLIPVCLTAAAWIAVGGALQRLYPFAYLLGLNVAQFLVFCGLLAPAALHLLAGHWTPRFGTWHDVLKTAADDDGVPIQAELLIWIGAVAACGLGALLSGWIYGVWPVGRPWLGLHTGAWVTGPVLVSLAAQVAGAILCIRRTVREAGPHQGHFTRMYLPPIEKR